MSDGEQPRRILAVDFGDRRTGLAATDYTGSIVVPLPKLDGLTDEDCAQEIAELVRDRGTEVVVLGMPLNREGAPGARAQRTAAFGKILAARCPCLVTTVDESHTTDEAHARLKAGGMKAAKRKQLADSVAAIVILERYRSGG